MNTQKVTLLYFIWGKLGIMGIPKEGEFVTIQSYKHDGHLHRTWRDTMVLKRASILWWCERSHVSNGIRRTSVGDS